MKESEKTPIFSFVIIFLIFVTVSFASLYSCKKAVEESGGNTAEFESGVIESYEYTYRLSTIDTKNIGYSYDEVVPANKQETMKKKLIKLFKLEDDTCEFEFPQESGEDEFLDKVFIDPITIDCKPNNK